MKTILVPTDFSKTAESALLYAAELAKMEKAKLILLHVDQTGVVNSYTPYDILVEARETIKKEVRKQLERLELKIASVGNIACESLVAEGFIFEVILSVIREKKVDMVVMGTKGATDFAGAIFGSNTAKIIEEARCPVIAVPQEAKFNGIKKITYATEYNNSDIDCLKKIVELARPFHAQVDILHVSDNKQSEKSEAEMLKKFMDEVNSTVQYNNMSFQLLNGKRVEEVLDEYIGSNSTSILAMSTHQRDFYDKLFGKSITKHMAYQVKIPLMAFHHSKKASVMLF